MDPDDLPIYRSVIADRIERGRHRWIDEPDTEEVPIVNDLGADSRAGEDSSWR